MYLSRGPVVCPAEKQCLAWVQFYLKDCVCSFRDEISLVLGLMSMVSWGVAEVPQIITNFREKSTDGVSVAFLMTWIIGDLFNLVGCYLEKNTLPTQLYVALLYTMTTLVLMGQTIYYDHFGKTQKPYMTTAEPSLQEETLHKEKASGLPQAENADRGYLDVTPSFGTIYRPRSHQTTLSPQSHYISARFLARSQTPPAASLLANACAIGSEGHGSSLLLQSSLPRSNGIAIPIPHSAPVGKSRAALLKMVGASGMLLIGGFHLRTTHLPDSMTVSQQTGLGIQGRKLLQIFERPRISSSIVKFQERSSTSAVPEILGWSMAAIYMSGRLPQIWLNITRKTIEGLNPLMFIFALVGNITYVGSIIVRTVEWSRLKPNLPWLVDAGICVLLDFFILVQCIYKAGRNEDDYELLK